MLLDIFAVENAILGHEFVRQKEATSSQVSYDVAKAPRLWELSAEMTKLKE